MAIQLESLWQNYKPAFIAGAVLAAVLASSVVVVPETEQAVIIRTGEPMRVANRFRAGEDYGQTGAGIVFRIPLLETVQKMSKQVLGIDMQRQQVLSSDQQRLQVDAFARFRIIDPVLMVETSGTEERVNDQLQPIFTSVLRQELGRRRFTDLIAAERGPAMSNIRANLDRQARKYGVQIIDVRIKRADLPDGTPLDSAFTRMQSAREQQAATIEAQGQKNAQIILAEAQAQSAKISAAAFGKDPKFYDFYRAMQSYDYSFAKDGSQSTIILSPDNEYLGQFKGER